ncbi:hypothetical protein DV515_00018626, partial [Chloebia gouldiae]
MPNCPQPLFGRDLLSLLNAKILFEGGRVKLEIPDEEIGKIFVIQEVDPTPIPDEISNAVVPWDRGTDVNLTIALLNMLGQAGYRVSKEKAQLVRKSVLYLGCELAQGQRRLGTNRVEAICSIPLPRSHQELRSFLGMVGWCRLWILNFGLIAKPLYEALKEPQEQDDVQLQTTSHLNPAEFLRSEVIEDELVHDCVEMIEQVYSSRQDLKDEPLDTADWELFTDGSSFVENGTRYAGYSVVTVFQVIEARALTPGTSAQKAEIIGLTRALILSTGWKVNIWTDLKYAFGVVHIHGALWRERGLLSSQGTAIKHQEEVVALLDAVHKPEQVAVMHVRGHQKEDGKIFRGNRLADAAAREAAQQVWTQMALIPTRTNPANPYLQQPPRYSREDEKLAALLKANKNATGWYVTNTGQVVVPSWIMKAILVAEHNKSHWGAEALVKFLKSEIVSNRMLSLAKRVNAMCSVCLKNNPVVRKQIQLGRLQVGPEPGDYWQVDFSELPKAQGYKYLLVYVCTFSGWPEAFPCRTNQAKEVIKTLLKEIIPRFGVPLGLSSDRGPHFIAHIVQETAR